MATPTPPRYLAADVLFTQTHSIVLSFRIDISSVLILFPRQNPSSLFFPLPHSTLFLGQTG